MADTDLILDEDRRSNWVRLRTLIWLRWIAIAGQTIALTVAHFFFGVSVEIGLFAVVVGLSVIANLVAIFIYPRNKRLSEHEVVGMLLFDVAQLSALLFLSGGLHNPFALFILVPVVISATALRPQSTVLIGLVAIVLITLVANWHYPLRTDQGIVLRVPRIFVFGSWVAIVIGVTFLGVYAWKVTSEIHSMSEAFLATQMALAREQKLTDLGGVVAAAAHELGTPLATIKLAAAELSSDLDGQKDLQADAKLIGEQADRCRDILRSMGHAGKDDLYVQSAPLDSVLHEAADPHKGRGKTVLIDAQFDDEDHPEVLRRPEIIHGLRNLIQNAVDFAESTVWVEATLDQDRIIVRIIDDGRGFSNSVIGRIGDPFVRRRRPETSRRPGYEGMGLGLFIAKTLLERTGAELSFANGSDPMDGRPHPGERSGAIVEVIWPRSRLAPAAKPSRTEMGTNKPIYN